MLASLLAQVRSPIPGVEVVPGDAAIPGDVATLQGLEWIFSNVVTVIIAAAGIVLFVMILIGGFNLLTAGAEAPKAEAAKKTITSAVLGMIFIALAYLVLRLISAVTGVEGILQFKIFQP